MANSETKKPLRNKLQWGVLEPFPEDKSAIVKLKIQALNRQLDRIFNRFLWDYCRKPTIQSTLDISLIYDGDICNIVDKECLRHPLSWESDKLVSHPKKDMTPTSKKDCPNEKLQSARKVLEERRCKFCSSENVIKYGKQNGHQRYKCKKCNHVFEMNQKFPRMRNDYRIIATAIDLYMEGLSLRKTARQIRKLYGVNIEHSTLLRWIQKYIPQVRQFTQYLTPESKRGIWHVDETAIRIKSKDKHCLWYWDCIDRDSRYVVGSHISKLRYIGDAQTIFEDAREQTNILPNRVICDGLSSYRRGLLRTYGWSRFSKIDFISKAGISKEMPSNNNRIERYHNEIKERTKIMRGMLNPMAILDGIRIHHNFIREHQTLKTTPARVSDIRLPMEDGWGDMIQFSTIYKTRCQMG